MRRGWAPALVAVGAAATVALVSAVGSGRAGPMPDPPPGAAIGAADRQSLGLVPVRPGARVAPVDPVVDLTDPPAVARRYLVAAHSTTGRDAGGTHLRAAGYALPGSPPATVGVLVLDPPPPGAVRTVVVTALELLAVDRDGTRRGYRAELGIGTGPPAGPVDVALVTRDVVVARAPDGRWLVAADTSPNPDLTVGEHR